MAPFPVEFIYGPTSIGIFLNLILYGIMVTQTYFYLTTFKNDKTWMKCFVMFVFLADTLNTVFDAAFLYKRLIYYFGDIEAILVADWLLGTDPAMTGLIALACQLFFAWRIKVLVGNYWIVGIVVLCSLIQCMGGLGTAIACSIVTNFADFHKFQIVVIFWLAFSCIADVIIAVTLTWHLRKQKTGFAFTDDILNRITRLTVQTGAITAIFAIVDVTAFVVTTSGLHFAFNMPLAKLYTNSLLSTLNSRAALSQSVHGGASSSGQHSNPPFQRKTDPGTAMISSRVQRHEFGQMDTYKDSHELNEVGVNNRVYINVEEVRSSV